MFKCLTLFVGIFGLPAQALTLQEAIRNAVTNRPFAEADQISLAVAQKQVEAAWWSSYSPSFTARYGLSSQSIEAPYTGQSGTYNSYRYGLNFPVVQGGASYHSVEAQRDREKAQQWHVKDSANQQAMEAVRAYISVLRTSELLEFNGLVRLMYEELKVLCRSDEDLAQILNALGENQGNRISLQTALKISKKLFALKVGLEPTDDLQDITEITQAFEPPSNLDEAVILAERNNPSLQQMQARIDSQTHSAKSTDYKNNWPALSGYVGKYSSSYPGGAAALRGVEIGAQVQWDFNLGGQPATQSQFLQVEEQRKRKQGELDVLKTNLDIAYIQLESLSDQEQLKQSNYRQTLDQYNQYIDQARKEAVRFKADTALNLLNAFRSAYADGNGLLASQMELASAQIEILAEVGALLQDHRDFPKRVTNTSLRSKPFVQRRK